MKLNLLVLFCLLTVVSACAQKTDTSKIQFGTTVDGSWNPGMWGGDRPKWNVNVNVEPGVFMQCKRVRVGLSYSFMAGHIQGFKRYAPILKSSYAAFNLGKKCTVNTNLNLHFMYSNYDRETPGYMNGINYTINHHSTNRVLGVEAGISLRQQLGSNLFLEEGVGSVFYASTYYSATSTDAFPEDNWTNSHRYKGFYYVGRIGFSYVF